MKWIRKALILTHRYLGIVLSLLFLVWFISGIGMMYAKGMPRLTPELRLLRLPAIDFSRIRLTPAEAVARQQPPANSNAGQAGQGGENRGAAAGSPAAAVEGAVAASGRGTEAARGAGGGRGGGDRSGQTEKSGEVRATAGANRGETAAAAQTQREGQAAATAAAGTTSTAPTAATGGGGGRGGRGGVGRVVVSAILDRPVYRIGGGRGGSIVFADDGTVLDGVNAEMAKVIASRFMSVSEDKLHYSYQTEVDQWTIAQRQQLPLHKFTVDDDSQSRVYVSPQSGEVALLTTRGSRALAWVAAIPHWLYFTPLRVNGLLWNRVITWTSGVGCVLALVGIALGITQFKASRPLQLSRVSSYIPYSGLMRWHYILGVIFGVFTLTWVFSGLLSMDPWEWVSGEDLRVNRAAFTDGPLDITQYPPLDPAAWAQVLPGRQIKEVEYTRIQGDPYYIAHTADSDRLLIAANPLKLRSEPFNTDGLIDRLKKAAPDARIIESELLTDYDSYYYSQGDLSLPVLRAKFDDPKQTWVYIDPAMGQVAGQIHRGNRIQRWLYNGFHSLDFSFWYGNQLVWEIGMIVLSLGGAVVSAFGLWIGMKRVGRGFKRFAKSLS